MAGICNGLMLCLRANSIQSAQTMKSHAILTKPTQMLPMDSVY